MPASIESSYAFEEAGSEWSIESVASSFGYVPTREEIERSFLDDSSEDEELLAMLPRESVTITNGVVRFSNIDEIITGVHNGIITLDLDLDVDIPWAHSHDSRIIRSIHVPALESLPKLKQCSKDMDIAHFVCYLQKHFGHLTGQPPFVSELDYKYFTFPRAIDSKEHLLPHERHPDAVGEDLQGIDWRSIGLSKYLAHKFRWETYIGIRNPPHDEEADMQIQPGTGSYAHINDLDAAPYFDFRHFESLLKARISHPQLRNVMTVMSRNTAFFSRGDKIICVNPSMPFEKNIRHHYTRCANFVDSFDEEQKFLKKYCVMDFSKASAFTSREPYNITCVQAGHGVLMAGGFEGQFAMKSVNTPANSSHIEGYLGQRGAENNVNHIEINLGPTSGLPEAVFATNDQSITTLDCNSNGIMRAHRYEWPMNCTATSPNKKLFVAVGDMRKALVCRTDNGEVVTELEGHTDYGFACAWSPDERYIATGNQDRTVQIWDHRKMNRPLQWLDCKMTGPRSLHFSPAGSGQPVLAVAESTDYVHIVDATTFNEQQTLDMFGEIGGVSFAEDGRSLFVANCDVVVGGLMEYERLKFGHGSDHDVEDVNNVIDYTNTQC